MEGKRVKYLFISTKYKTLLFSTVAGFELGKIAMNKCHRQFLEGTIPGRHLNRQDALKGYKNIHSLRKIRDILHIN